MAFSEETNGLDWTATGVKEEAKLSSRRPLFQDGDFLIEMQPKLRETNNSNRGMYTNEQRTDHLDCLSSKT